MVSRERWKEGAIVPFAVAVQVGGGSVQVSGTLANNLSQRMSNSTLPVPRVSGASTSALISAVSAIAGRETGTQQIH